MSDTAINLEYQVSLQKIQSNYSDYHLKQAVESNLSVNKFSLCALLRKQPEEYHVFLLKSSLKQASHDKNCVSLLQCMYVVILVVQMCSCFQKFERWLIVEEEQDLDKIDTSVNIFVFPAPNLELETIR